MKGVVLRVHRRDPRTMSMPPASVLGILLLLGGAGLMVPLDTVAASPGLPHVPIAPADGAWLNITRPLLSWAAASPGGEPQAAAQIQISTSPTFANSAVDRVVAGNSTNWTSTALLEGNYSWRIRTQDPGGNWSLWSVTGYFHVDVTGPFFTELWFGPDVPDRTNRSTVPVFLNASLDITPELIEVSLRVDNGTWSAFGPITSPSMVTLSPGDGERLIGARLRDPAGNAGEEWARAIVVDTVPPRVGNVTDAPWSSNPNTGEVLLQLDASDGDDQPAAISAREEGGNWSVWKEYANQVTVWVRPGIGPRGAEVRVRDLAGNIGAPLNTSFFLGRVDITQIGFESNTNEGTTTVDLAGIANANCTDRVEVRLNEGPWVPAKVSRSEQGGVTWQIAFRQGRIPSPPVDATARAACGTIWIESTPRPVLGVGDISGPPTGGAMSSGTFFVLLAIIPAATVILLIFILRRPKDPASSAPSSAEQAEAPIPGPVPAPVPDSPPQEGAAPPKSSH